MEHGSIITQARKEDALVLTKQGRGATSQNFALPPGGEGAEDPAGTGGSVGSRAPVGTRTPVGAERGPGCQRPAGGCHPRSCHPSGHPSPREQAETPGARVAPGHPRRPHPSRGDGVVTPPPPPLHACPGAAGRARGVPSWNAAGTGVLVQDWDARALGRGGAGTRDEVHRPEAGVGEGEGRRRSGPSAGLLRFG